jgi:hypothetical protein
MPLWYDYRAEPCILEHDLTSGYVIREMLDAYVTGNTVR